MTLIIDLSRSSNVKSDDANRKPVDPTYKCSQSPTSTYHCFRDISSQSILTMSKVQLSKVQLSKVKFNGANRKPMSTFLYDLCLVQHRISYRSRHISRQIVWPWFLTPRVIVKSDDANRKPWVPTYKCSVRSILVSFAVFEIFWIKGFWRWPLTPRGHPRLRLMVPIESP